MLMPVSNLVFCGSRSSSGDALAALTWTCTALKLAFKEKNTTDVLLQKLVGITVIGILFSVLNDHSVFGHHKVHLPNYF